MTPQLTYIWTGEVVYNLQRKTEMKKFYLKTDDPITYHNREDMNFSGSSTSDTISVECEIYEYLGGRLDRTATWAYVLLIFITVVNITTCPFIIILNVLVMIAVKTKARLKTNSNITLCCLAFIDVLVGIIAQPVFAAVTILTMQGETSNKHCTLQRLSRIVVKSLCGASFCQLALISVERYLAIKHSFTYTSHVTKARILGLSAVTWISIMVQACIPFLITDENILLTVSYFRFPFLMAIIVFCHIAVYREIRRHEKQIAAHQISEEAREKFLKEGKALKLTTTVLFILLLCYLPSIIVRILLQTSTINRVKTAHITFFTTSFVAILNSLINPVIYCVRIKHFRIAFVEILLRKNYTQAERFRLRVFERSTNIVVPLEATQEGEEPPNNEQENANDNIIHGSNIMASIATS